MNPGSLEIYILGERFGHPGPLTPQQRGRDRFFEGGRVKNIRMTISFSYTTFTYLKSAPSFFSLFLWFSLFFPIYASMYLETGAGIRVGGYTV